MKLYLDTEFNGFGGELMSLGLVPADPSLPEFYRVVKWTAPVDPWVQQHVVPFLGREQEEREVVARDLAAFLGSVAQPVVVADWPDDFSHLMGLLITGPGLMVAAPDFDMEFRRLPGFNTASTSRIPHNALEDARALRDHCVRLDVQYPPVRK